jgi:hypothetical protein
VQELVARYDLEADDALLAEAETLLRRALAADPSRAEVHLLLSTVWLRRGKVSGDLPLVDSALAAARDAEAATPRDDPLWPLVQAQLSWAACARFELERRPRDLTEAMRYAENALRAVDPADLDAPEVLLRCVNTYRLGFERFGRLADVDTAVRLSRLIMASEEPVHQLAGRMSLAAALAMRYGRTGVRADIDEAVDQCRAALAGVPERHIDRIPAHTTLVFALMQRWLRGDGDGDATDLRDALQASRSLIAVLPRSEPIRAQLLANHAVLLSLQAFEGASPRHLDEAVRRAREAVEAQSGGAQRAVHLANLVNVSLLQARLSSDPAGVSAAVDIGKAALAGLSPGNPDRARALNILGQALRIRHLIDRDPADLDAAVGMWRAAAGSRVGPIEVRMSAARNWARAAAETGDSAMALEAHAAAVRLLPVLAWRGLDRAVQEKRLATTSGLASTAAAWALAAGEPERAVELLEQGRQVLWSQAVQTRSDLSVLSAVAPSLATELDAVRAELDGTEASMTVTLPAPGPGSGVRSGDRQLLAMGQDLLNAAVSGPQRSDAEDAGHRRRLAERWEELLGEARRQPGLENFLTAPSFDSLRQAAADGAVLLVSAAPPRSDALIVTSGRVRPVPLPWLTEEAAQRRASALLTAQREVERGGGTVARAALRQTLVSIQRWLWDTVAEPVLTVLDEIAPTGPDGRHRVWWCPAGPLTMLPLHAAGRFGANQPLAERRRLSVAARCVSSYTPSLSALLRARTAAPPAGPPRAFAVGLGTLPGQAPLPAVSDELRAVSSHVPGLRVLTGRSATVEAVLTALETHGWAHFACHGDQDFERPSAGALHLADGKLSVLDLAGRLAARTRSAGGADLAYLSACRTAAGGRDLPDEAIHLTAALQLAGFRHVIGSQWAVSDRVAAQVATDVYADLAAGGRLDAAGAAWALDRAIDRVRREHPDRPDLWAALIHTGP